MARFVVTVQRIVLTEIEIDAETKADARSKIEEYGADLAAVDMSTNDTISTRIKSVKPAKSE